MLSFIEHAHTNKMQAFLKYELHFLSNSIKLNIYISLPIPDFIYDTFKTRWIDPEFDH